jgi:DNA-binding MarR family transcriptional regulator
MPPYTAETMRSDTNVGRLIARVRHSILLAIDAKLAPLDLTAAQWAVVVYLAEGLASTPAELASLLDSDRGAMTRLIDRLADKNMIERRPHSSDRRSVTLVLTDTGRAAYPAIRPQVVEVLNTLLTGFEEHEVRQLEELLQRMLANARQT